MTTRHPHHSTLPRSYDQASSRIDASVDANSVLDSEADSNFMNFSHNGQPLNETAQSFEEFDDDINNCLAATNTWHAQRAPTTFHDTHFPNIPSLWSDSRGAHATSSSLDDGTVATYDHAGTNPPDHGVHHSRSQHVASHPLPGVVADTDLGRPGFVQGNITTPFPHSSYRDRVHDVAPLSIPSNTFTQSPISDDTFGSLFQFAGSSSSFAPSAGHTPTHPIPQSRSAPLLTTASGHGGLSAERTVKYKGHTGSGWK